MCGLPAALSAADRVLRRDRHGLRLDGATGDLADDGHFGAAHPDDRPLLARAWVRATADPGTVQSAAAWTRVGGEWRYRRYDYLSRLDDPADPVVYVGITDTEAPPGRPISPPDRPTTDARWSILQLTAMGEIVRAEGTLVELYGRTAGALVGTNGLDLVHPDDHATLLDAWAKILDGTSPGRALRQRVLHVDGSVTWVLASMGRPDADGTITVHDLDLTEQLLAEDALRASETRFRQLARDLPTGVFVADDAGDLEYRNPQCDELLGDVGSMAEHLATGAGASWAAMVAAATRSGRVEQDLVTDDDRVLRIRIQRPLPDGSVCGVIEDVTAAVRWREEAVTDDLTGLANRPAIVREVQRRMDAGHRAVVAFVDLDGFKRVNDQHGHEEGDRVLRGVAAALEGLIRDDDVAGRWGGDEFVLVLGDLPPDARMQLRRRVDEAMIACGAGGASVGFAMVDHPEPVGAVIARADTAMYEDKRTAATGLLPGH